MGSFLGMESGGDVKFYSPGAPVSPHFSSILIAEVRRGHPGCKILHHRLTPYPEITPFCYPEYFKKYPEFLRVLKPKPQGEQPFPFHKK